MYTVLTAFTVLVQEHTGPLGAKLSYSFDPEKNRIKLSLFTVEHIEIV